MRRALLHVLYAAAAIQATSPAPANPIVLGLPPSRLTAEEVVLRVREKDSLVTGDYVFEAIGPVPNLKEGNNVTLELPVPLPTRLTIGEQAAVAKPTILIGKSRRDAVQFYPGDGPDMPPNLPPLPNGWTYRVFFFPVYFASGLGHLKVRITYTQPHLPGGVAAYLAILPERTQSGNYA